MILFTEKNPFFQSAEVMRERCANGREVVEGAGFEHFLNGVGVPHQGKPLAGLMLVIVPILRKVDVNVIHATVGWRQRKPSEEHSHSGETRQTEEHR